MQDAKFLGLELGGRGGKCGINEGGLGVRRLVEEEGEGLSVVRGEGG